MLANVKAAAIALGMLPSALAIGFGSDFIFQNGNLRLLSDSFPQPGLNATYDYIVVGGGPAGMTVAKRLAENPAVTVAVVEAGGYYEINSGNSSQIPALNANSMTAADTIDWGIVTTPQQQLNNRTIAYRWGKCLGGSSARGNMVYQRGSTMSYDLWAQAVGDSSWKMNNTMQYFQKSCKFTPPNIGKRGGPIVQYDQTAWSNAGGPLNIAYWGFYSPVSAFFGAALQKMGFNQTSKANTGAPLGFAQYVATVNPQSLVRDSSESSFGTEALMTTSLKFYIDSLVKKIIFDGKVAKGISVVTAGQKYNLTANREVILAAGPIFSPQILMVSGVGPTDQLNSVKVPVVAALPGVGQNMRDVPEFNLVFPVNQTTQHEIFSNDTFAAEQAALYYANQTGYFSMYGGNYLAYEKLPGNYTSNFTSSQRSELASFPSDWPDVEFMFNLFGSLTPKPAGQVRIGISLQHPTSIGQVRINSSDTADKPLFDPQWLATGLDQAVAVQALKRARDIAAASGALKGPEIQPGPNITTNADILKWLKAQATTRHFAVATCKMGQSNDSMAVVDTNGKVLGGVKGLRIVDSSIWPFNVPGQPMATTYMVAEKLAAAIQAGK